MKRGIKINLVITIIVMSVSLFSSAQKVAVKSNALAWLTATPTLGVEVGLADRWSLNTHIYYNPFTFKDNRKWKHIRVQPEVRYWLCQTFNGHFFGLHLLYTHFNAGQVPLSRFVPAPRSARCRIRNGSRHLCLIRQKYLPWRMQAG